MNTTRPPMPRRITSLSSSALNAVSPKMTPSLTRKLSPTIRKRASLKSLATIAAASKKYSIPFIRFSLERTATSGTRGGNPSSARSWLPLCFPANLERSIPFRITKIFSRGYPSAMSRCLTASAFTAMPSARRHTNLCTRLFHGVSASPSSLMDATITGAPASLAAGMAKTLA